MNALTAKCACHLSKVTSKWKTVILYLERNKFSLKDYHNVCDIVKEIKASQVEYLYEKKL